MLRIDVRNPKQRAAQEWMSSKVFGNMYVASFI